MRARTVSFAILLLLLVPSLARPAQNPKKQTPIAKIGSRDLTRGQLDFYSRQKEYEMGRGMAEELESLVTLDTDPALDSYMQRLTDRIARNSDARVPVRMRVILSNDIDAIALPGGFLYLTTGLILQTHSEAELAGVIAHEVAHIASRDTTRQMTQEKIWDWASLPLLFVGGPVAAGARDTMAFAAPLSIMASSRRAEREADFHGLQYLYKAGYDPVAFVSFFERARKLEKDPHSTLARAFGSHPMTKDRVKDAQREIQKDLPPRVEYVETTSQYQNARAGLENYLRDEFPFVPATPLLPKLKKKERNDKSKRSEDRP